MNKKQYDYFENKLHSWGITPQTSRAILILLKEAYIEGQRDMAHEFLKEMRKTTEDLKS